MASRPDSRSTEPALARRVCEVILCRGPHSKISELRLRRCLQWIAAQTVVVSCEYFFCVLRVLRRGCIRVPSRTHGGCCMLGTGMEQSIAEVRIGCCVRTLHITAHKRAGLQLVSSSLVCWVG